MIAPSDLEGYIAEQYGGAGHLIVRDPEQSGGLREWSRDDTEKLCRWLESHGGSQADRSICQNLRETADSLGVAAQTVQRWMRRREHPLPHMREGRRIMVPRDMLLAWVEEEVRRNLKAGREKLAEQEK